MWLLTAIIKTAICLTQWCLGRHYAKHSQFHFSFFVSIQVTSEKSKSKQMSTLFCLSSDSAIMFAFLFMTSTDVLQTQDSIRFFPLPSINRFFMAGRVRGRRNKPLRGWAAFVNLICLLSNKILLGDPQSPSEVNICLGNLLHTSFLRWTVGLHHHADPQQLSICVFMPERRAIDLDSMKQAQGLWLQENSAMGYAKSPGNFITHQNNFFIYYLQRLMRVRE